MLLATEMFPVLKRKYGEKIKAREYWNQVKEIKIKLLVHNLAYLPRLPMSFK